MNLLRDRGENVPPEELLRVAESIKEEYSYVCPDIVKEFKKYDKEPDKYFKKYKGVSVRMNVHGGVANSL